MQGQRFKTEDKIRILREADCGKKSIGDVCRDKTLSAMSFPLAGLLWFELFEVITGNHSKQMNRLEEYLCD
jgi:hypothetical protein